jgi:hypothetical protein
MAAEILVRLFFHSSPLNRGGIEYRIVEYSKIIVIVEIGSCSVLIEVAIKSGKPVEYRGGQSLWRD